LYPYSNWVARGWLIDVPDKTKEICVFSVASCLLIFLFARG
jgi:hypothetical protein